jgi:hypothetical protein
VFGRGRTPLSSMEMHRRWRRIVAKARVRYRLPGQLRHTFPSTMLSLNTPRLYVQQQGGWRGGVGAPSGLRLLDAPRGGRHRGPGTSIPYGTSAAGRSTPECGEARLVAFKFAGTAGTSHNSVRRPSRSPAYAASMRRPSDVESNRLEDLKGDLGRLLPSALVVGRVWPRCLMGSVQGALPSYPAYPQNHPGPP